MGGVYRIRLNLSHPFDFSVVWPENCWWQYGVSVPLVVSSCLNNAPLFPYKLDTVATKWTNFYFSTRTTQKSTRKTRNFSFCVFGEEFSVFRVENKGRNEKNDHFVDTVSKNIDNDGT